MSVHVGIRGPGHLSRTSGDTGVAPAAPPDAFSFTDATSARLSTVYTSNTVGPANGSGVSAITVTGGEYSLNGGAFTSAAGDWSPGDTVAVRGTSSASVSTAVNVVLDIGGVSDTFAITTVVNTETSSFLGRVVAAGTEPTATRRGLYDTYIGSLKSGATSGSNIWAKLDIIYLLAAHEQSAALLNLKGATYNATNVNSTTFAVDDGFTGDAVSMHISTNFLDNTAAVNWTQDSAFAGVWVAVDGGGVDPVLGVAGGGAQAIVTPFQTSTARGRIHCTTNSIVSAVDRTGWKAVNRTGATSQVTYQNDTAGANIATASSVVGAVTIYLLRNNLTYAADRITAAVLGGGLTTAEHTDLYNALNTYLTAIGAH